MGGLFLSIFLFFPLLFLGLGLMVRQLLRTMSALEESDTRRLYFYINNEGRARALYPNAEPRLCCLPLFKRNLRLMLWRRGGSVFTHFVFFSLKRWLAVSYLCYNSMAIEGSFAALWETDKDGMPSSILLIHLLSNWTPPSGEVCSLAFWDPGLKHPIRHTNAWGTVFLGQKKLSIQ